MPFTQRLAQHLAGDLREPIVDSTEECEQQSAKENIVEVRYDEIGIGQLPVERSHRQHDAGKPRDQELEDERDTEKHRRCEADSPAPHGSYPVENLDARGYANDH